MNVKLAMFVSLLALSLSTTARSEVWSCNFDGSWATHGSADSGEFIWSVTWTADGRSGWRIIGDYSDEFGDSILDGECSARNCTLRQVYQNGAMAGREFTWLGRYTDEEVNSSRTINRFDGTWGETRHARDGTWRAVAICVRD